MTAPIRMIGPEVEPHLDWRALGAAFVAGHQRPRAEIADSFLYHGANTVLNRAALIPGLGLLVKTATVWPDNPASGRPMVGGGATLYDVDTGALVALIDFHLLTRWKTAGDSAFAASRLARPDSKTILIVGAGTVGAGLRRAYAAWFPEARFLIWNRTPDKARAFAERLDCTPVDDLEAGFAQADIVTSATMSTEPFIRGAWLRPGQHLDLIGAYRPDMREADDTAISRARVFVDSRATTVGHIGEIEIPLRTGVLSPADIVADFYDLDDGTFARTSAEEITLFKNGGGAHLDLMTAGYILDAATET